MVRLKPWAVVVEPLPAGLLRLIPTDREADGLMDDFRRIAGLNDDYLQDVLEGASPVGVDLPDPKANDGAYVGVEGRVGQGGGDRVAVGQ